LPNARFVAIPRRSGVGRANPRLGVVVCLNQLVVNSRHAPSSPAIDREPSSVAAGPSQAPPYTRAPLGPSAERRRWRTRACGACWRLLGPATRFLPSWNLVGIRSYCGVTRACVVPGYMRPCVCACVRASACCLYVRDCVGAWLRAFRACVPACLRACVPACLQWNNQCSGEDTQCAGVCRVQGGGVRCRICNVGLIRFRCAQRLWRVRGRGRVQKNGCGRRIQQHQARTAPLMPSVSNWSSLDSE
jgi:hypothetical protein